MVSEPTSQSRRLVRAFGYLLVLGSLYFLAEQLVENWQAVIDAEYRALLMSIIAGCALLYGASLLLLSGGWCGLLRWLGERDISISVCHELYGRTQIAKYIPGNIFHFAGRHMLGREAGCSHLALAGAAVYEVLGLLLAAGVIGLIGLFGYGFNSTLVAPGYVVGAVAGGLALTAIIGLLLPRFRILGQTWPAESTFTALVRGIGPSYLAYVLFFLVDGGILVAIVWTTAGVNGIGDIGLIITVFSIAWIIGFVTPGAPGGIGVREFVIVVSLGRVIGDPASLTAALAFRLTTVLGDIAFFLGTRLFSRPEQVGRANGA